MKRYILSGHKMIKLLIGIRILSNTVGHCTALDISVDVSCPETEDTTGIMLFLFFCLVYISSSSPFYQGRMQNKHPKLLNALLQWRKRKSVGGLPPPSLISQWTFNRERKMKYDWSNCLQEDRRKFQNRLEHQQST